MAKAVPDQQEVVEKFMCFLCHNSHEDLKVIGDCHHCACRDCLQKHIQHNIPVQYNTTSRNRIRTFKCPECRSMYKIPQNGVNGFKDFSKLKNVMKRYMDDIEKKVNETESNAKVCCIICADQKRKIKASHRCQDCSGQFTLCKDCAATHLSSTAAKGHNVIELCEEHGLHLNQYCATCKSAICDVCLHSRHSGADHVIKPLADVLKEARVEMTAIAGRLRKDDEEKKINQTRNAMKTAAESQLVPLNRKADNVIGNANRECEKLQRESQSLGKQMEELVKQKRGVDLKLGEAESKRDTHMKTKEYYCQQIKNVQRITTDEINDVTEKIKAKKEKIVVQLTNSEKLFASKCVETLNLVKEDIKWIDATLEHLTSINQIKENMPKFVPARNNNEIGLMANQKYLSLRKETDLSDPDFPGDQCFEALCVKFLADGRIVTIDRLSDSSEAVLQRLLSNTFEYQGRVVHNGRLCLHNPATPTECYMINTNIDKPMDMTVKTTGHILVLTETDRIQVVNTYTHDINTITTKHTRGYKKRHLQLLETDDEDNIFVKFLNGKIKAHLLVMNMHGTIMQDNMPVEEGSIKAMAYCRVTQILYTITRNKLSKYHWNRDSKVLSRGLTSTLEVEGFSCSDVGIGGAGEILIAGVMNNRESRIYQAVESDGSIFTMKQLIFEDGEARISHNNPHIAVQKDKIILAYCKNVREKRHLELFKLVR